MGFDLKMMLVHPYKTHACDLLTSTEADTICKTTLYGTSQEPPKPIDFDALAVLGFYFNRCYFEITGQDKDK